LNYFSWSRFQTALLGIRTRFVARMTNPAKDVNTNVPYRA